jgi:hypothetical protein
MNKAKNNNLINYNIRRKLGLVVIQKDTEEKDQVKPDSKKMSKILRDAIDKTQGKTT